MIQRIHAEGVSDDEVRAYYSGDQAPELFPDLFARFRESLQALAAELVHLPDDDPYWNAAAQSQNFGDAVREWLEHRLRENPNDEFVLWGRLGIAVMGSSHFGGVRWLPLLAQDARSVRWLVESSVWVGLNTGADCTAELAELLQRFASRRPGVRAELERYASSSDPFLAQAAKAAIGIMDGRSLPLPDYWQRKE